MAATYTLTSTTGPAPLREGQAGVGYLDFIATDVLGGTTVTGTTIDTTPEAITGMSYDRKWCLRENCKNK